MRPRKGTSETPGRVLAAACQVFAEKGYRDAKISEICRCAGANVAAVNYHFGDKESLYAEAWRSSFDAALEAHPPDGGVPDDAPPQERLHGRVKALIQRIADPHNYEFEILSKEMGAPTGFLDQAMKEAIEPLRTAMRGIVGELLGGDAPELHVGFCARSVISQCTNLRMRRRLRGSPDPLGPEHIDELADHVTRFSIAGIRAVGEWLARADRPGTEAGMPAGRADG